MWKRSRCSAKDLVFVGRWMRRGFFFLSTITYLRSIINDDINEEYYRSNNFLTPNFSN